MANNIDYNGSDKWRQRATELLTQGGGGGASELGDLQDVTLINPTTGQALVFDGTKWVNADVAGTQEQADWAQTDTTAVDYIKNKPTDATQSASGLMSSTDKTKLDGIASGAEVNVQSDWSQSDNTADDYIKNKPNTTYTGNGNIDITSNVVTRKEVWLTMAEYTALQNPDADTDYHIEGGFQPSELPITVVNGKLCYIYYKEV